MGHVNEVMLSTGVFETLVKQLVNLEDDRHELLERYIKVPAERETFSRLLDGYITKVDRIIRNSARSEAADCSIPFVAINSEVELEDLKSGESFRVAIVSPFDENAKGRGSSYLSPLGSSLLLKGVGEEVVVQSPGGEYRYRVVSVNMALQ